MVLLIKIIIIKKNKLQRGNLLIQPFKKNNNILTNKTFDITFIWYVISIVFESWNRRNQRERLYKSY